MHQDDRYVRWFETLNNTDVPLVGGKNASLGEMVHTLKDQGIPVPHGFATTAAAYWEFLKANDLSGKIEALLKDWRQGAKSLEETGKAIRRLFLRAQYPQEIAAAISIAYHELSRRYNVNDVDVAVRSSATAEDLPDASFAGQQESFLNVTGDHELMEACRRCYASLFTDRAMIYRQEKGFDHLRVALSIGVQKMVRADKAGSGVMFTIDTETGFRDVAVINAAWGLGENVVQGTVNPDEYMVFKPLLANPGFTPIIEKNLGAKEKKLVYAVGGTKTTRNLDTARDERNTFVLSDAEILTLARWAVTIEQHYGKPMDIEWAKDGDTGRLFIVQARPETVQSRREAGYLKTYEMQQKGKRLLTGLAIGEAIAAGRVCRIKSAADIARFQDDAILVTEMTDPDWVPIMKRARGIVTDHGGRTCHAAIVSRELGIPAIVGTGKATEILKNGQEITISGAEGDQGYVYEGLLQVPGNGGQPFEPPRDPDPDHDEHRLPRRGLPLVAPAGEGHRPGPHGIHHQQHHQDSPPGPAPFRPGDGPGDPPGDSGPDPGVRGQGGIFCGQPGPGDRQDRRLPVSRAGDRPHE